MNGVGAKAVAFFVLLLLANESYVLLGESTSVNPQTSSAVELLDSITSTLGYVVPKANSYAEYFNAIGMSSLGSQLIRVNGFCLITFLFALICFAGACLFKRKRPAAENVSPEALTGTRYVERIAIMTGIIHAYQTFIGFGLSPRSSYLAESTTGANVITNPVVSFPFLFVVIFYVASSRQYLSCQQRSNGET